MLLCYTMFETHDVVIHVKHVEAVKWFVTGVKCHVKSVKCHVKSVKCHVKGVKCHVQGVKCHVKGVKLHEKVHVVDLEIKLDLEVWTWSLTLEIDLVVPWKLNFDLGSWPCSSLGVELDLDRYFAGWLGRAFYTTIMFYYIILELSQTHQILPSYMI